MIVEGAAQSSGAQAPRGSGTPTGRNEPVPPRKRSKPARAEPVPGPSSPRPDPPVTTRPHFVVDEVARRVAILVIDRDSGKVVRQIPPEEIMKLARMHAQQLGVLFETQG